MANSRTEFHPQRLLETLNRYSCEGQFIVAFSGGADSSALLLAMSEIREQLPHPLKAVHINHAFHPDADEWERHCRQFCGNLGLDLHCTKVRPNLESGRGPEAELRTLRYGAFEKLLDKGDLLLLAHHRDDQVETLLINLMRGSGVEGLSGMPECRILGRGQLARPLLSWGRSELQEFLVSRHAGWLEDPGNLDPRPDRNFLRLEVLPLARSRWPSLDQSLFRSAAYCLEAWNLLQGFGHDQLRPQLCSPQALVIHPDWPTNLPLLKLLLRLWLTEAGAPSVPAAKLEEFCRQLGEARAGAAIELAWNDWRVRRFRDRLWLQEDATVSTCPERAWPPADSLDLGPVLGTLRFKDADPPAFGPGLRVGPRPVGGSIELPGRGRQNVNELLRISGVPPWLRDSVPILSRENELLAVGDWAVAPALLDWLRQTGTSLHWSPLDPVLKLVRSECHGALVESHDGLG